MRTLRPLHRPRAWLGLWLFLLGATLVLCLVPLPRIPLEVSGLDKWEHSVGYALLSAYAAMLFATPRLAGFAALGLAGYGLAIEGLQGLTTWRSADLRDAVANAVGAGAGLLVAFTPAARLLQRVDGWLRPR